jgi:hypothetical protein
MRSSPGEQVPKKPTSTGKRASAKPTKKTSAVAPKKVHWQFKESDRHLMIDLCQAMPSAIKKEGSLIFKPHNKRTGRYVGECADCECIGTSKGLM